MNRAEMIREIASRARLSAISAEMALDAVLNSICEAASNGDTVQLRGFGSFRLKKMVARTARNPRTGEEVHVPERLKLHFTASKSLNF